MYGAGPGKRVVRLHRDIFPATDHGYTWTECYWIELDGVRKSPISPIAGCNERLGEMPAGKLAEWVIPQFAEDCADSPIVKSETTHAGYWHVGAGVIVNIPE